MIPLTEARAIIMLTNRFDVWNNRCFPNVLLCGGEMDLAVVSRSGFLWEVEVKLTRYDWLADARKSKWTVPGRRFVSRFFYAVPEALISDVPEFVPDSAGLIAFQGDTIREVRTARRHKAPKLPDAQMRALYESTYHRFWRERLHRHRQIEHATKRRISGHKSGRARQTLAGNRENLLNSALRTQQPTEAA
ncbi:MAG: MmcB family DNA repair protein [Gammaproteobacteria bacterium]